MNISKCHGPDVGILEWGILHFQRGKIQVVTDDGKPDIVITMSQSKECGCHSRGIDSAARRGSSEPRVSAERLNMEDAPRWI